MCFDNEINTTYKYNQTCLSELQSTGIPTIRNKLLGTDFSQRISPLQSGSLAVRNRLGKLGTDMPYQEKKNSKPDYANSYLVVY